MQKIKVLFFAANPAGSHTLLIGEEIREITQKIRAAEYHDAIELVLALATRRDDLLLELNEHKPRIVHFSAHGKPTGEILLLDELRFPKPVSPEAIQALFKSVKNNIRVVILNACYARRQAQAIVEEIDCAIGIGNPISNRAAIIFAAAFYQAVGFGLSVKEAFEQGRTALLLEGIEKENFPELLVKIGIDPARIYLLEDTHPISTGTDDIETHKSSKEKVSLGKLREITFSRITRGLNNKEGYFFKKYITDVYQARAEAESVFSRFLKQSEKRCFIITGRAGKGKTSLLCHLTEQIMLNETALIPVLLNSPEINLLKTNLKEYITGFFSSGKMNPTFDEISECLAGENGRLVIIIDAVNELEGENVFHLFNEQITGLFHVIKEKKYPFLFCVSCRSEFWSQFSSEKWVNENIFEPWDGFENTTHELKDFEEKKIDAVIKAYFHWYALSGKVIGDARLKCCDPIMLRYLCEAYTKRMSNDKKTPPEEIETTDIGVKKILQRKEVFRLFAENIRERMFLRAKKLLGLKDEKNTLFEITTNYLIHLAKFMMKNGRSHFTIEEAYDVARDIGHPDGDLKRHEFYGKDNRSIFFMFIDEGIVLDKRGNRTYDFVFESYLEYSLGRYFALHKWLNLPGNNSGPHQGVNPEAIKDDFRELLNQHNRLMKEKNFTNILGALEYAILVIEANEDYKGYETYPELFIELIEIMMDSEQFIFRQKAFAALRETQLLMGYNVTNKEKKLQRIMEIFYQLTKKVDFVIAWDLGHTLTQLSKHEADFVIDRMEAWAEEGEKIQPMFAAQVLARVSFFYPQKGIDVLLKLSGVKTFRENFWLARSLIFAAKELGMNAKKSRLENEYIKKLRNMLKDFYEDGDVSNFTRGLALSVLPFLSDKDMVFLEKIGNYVKQEKYLWAVWNLAYELREWVEPFDAPCHNSAWIWDILGAIIDLDNPHLNYAVFKTARALEPYNPGKADEILGRVDSNYWLPERFERFMGEYDRTKGHLTGIVYSPVYLEPSFNNHIECRERLEGILEKLINLGEGYFNWVAPGKAEPRHLRSVHNEHNDRHRDGSKWPGYLDEVKKASEIFASRSNTVNIPVGPSELRYESYDVALVSCGGVISAVDYVMNNPARAVWSMGRPPGHLANNTICILNNIAIGACYAKKKYNKKRIFIVDCDAHHGKHTYWVFRSDPEVIYFSIHIDGDYAREEGKIEDIGENQGEGYNFNLPYPLDMGDDGYNEIVDKLLIPVVEEYKPDLLMISAGFDGHFEDNLTPGLILSEHAYIHLAEKLRDLARQLDIKIVGVFEGGYGLQSLANSYVHMINIIGDWAVQPDAIGFVEGKEKYEVDHEALNTVRTQIKKRVELMKKTKENNPAYPLFTNMDYWNEILNSSV